MSHSHSHREAVATLTPAVRRLLIGAVVALSAVVLVGLVLLWPHGMSAHVDSSLTSSPANSPSTVSARIDQVQPASCRGVAGSTQATSSSTKCGRLTFTVLEGAHAGQQGSVVIPASSMQVGPKAGQRVIVAAIDVPNQPTKYQFVDFQRLWPMVGLAIAFVVVVGLVARLRGLLAIVGLGIAGWLLLAFVFPALVSGENAIGVGIVGAVAIMIVVVYTAHGVNARSTTALLGTVAGIVLCAALSVLATRVTNLTGVISEDDVLLGASAPDLNLVAGLMCGIMIAGLGVLNDVTITQASAVWELADSGYDARTLYRRAMRIGRDHIASTIYTIAFATAGASMTTFLLITVYQRPLGQLMQSELFAEEIVRTLVGSIGLVLAVPITTALGVAVVRSGQRRATATADA